MADPNQTAHLRPFNTLTPEERKALQSKGGKAAQEKRRYDKTFKAAMEWALDLPAMKGNPMVDRIRREYPGLTNRDAMAIAMTAETIQKQNVKAFLAVRDTTGELPAQTVNIQNAEPMTITIKTIGDDDEEDD